MILLFVFGERGFDDESQDFVWKLKEFRRDIRGWRVLSDDEFTALHAAFI